MQMIREENDKGCVLSPTTYPKLLHFFFLQVRARKSKAWVLETEKDHKLRKKKTRPKDKQFWKPTNIKKSLDLGSQIL